MKCVILAGGSGDGLWPLSRKDYPKQFLNFHRKLSLFQETIVRNMPLVDEFYIITGEKYHSVVDGQLRQFHGLKYRVFLEEVSCGTAGALAAVCQWADPKEQLLILPADLVISGEGYTGAVYEARKIQEESDPKTLVLFGVRAEQPSTSYGYIRHHKEQVLRFMEKPSQELANRIFADDDILWNSGMLLGTAGGLKQHFMRYVPRLTDYMGKVVSHASYLKHGEVLLNAKEETDLPRQSIESAVLEKCRDLAVVEMSCRWSDISDLEGFCREFAQEEGNAICHDSRHTTVINTAPEQLVVVNHLQNAYVVNTADAVYVTDRDKADEIREIIEKNTKEYQDHFDVSVMKYRPWGTSEMLRSEPGYRVRKVIIYPGMSLTRHIHEKRNETYTVAKGVLTVELETENRRVGEGESISISPGTLHRLYNETDQEIAVIEVDTGAEIAESDMVHFEEMAKTSLPHLYALKPAFKDYLWGGRRLVDQFHKNSPYEITAESWELSAHKAGQSRICGGPFDGMPFGEFVEQYGSVVCGWKSNTFDHFPILIKFIDARESLSIQIHPGDDYAFLHEGEFGKNEVWYVMDAAENACLYCGLKYEVDREELRHRIADGTITEVLNEIRVKPGDVVFVPAGTIHAIGAGILVCEIQQNSNSTYRVYDYKRVDKTGKQRELQVEKALDVVNTTPYLPDVKGFAQPERRGDNSYQILSQCKYFQTAKYTIKEEETLVMDDASFLSLVFLDGEAQVSCEGESIHAGAGDSLFVSAGRKVVHVKGTCELIATNI